MGDLDQQVGFGSDKGVLVLSGTPYWMAWTRRSEQLLEELERRYPDIDSEEAFKKRFKTDPEFAELMKQYARAEEKDSIVQLPKLSRAISRKVSDVDGVNPIVYRALTNTVRYTALFRHAKGTAPAAFKQLRERLSTVRVSPSVETPTIQYVSLQ